MATPHATPERPTEGSGALVHRIVDFNNRVQNMGIDLEVLVGTEHLLTMDLIDDVRRENVVTLNGSRYLLV